ncbi:MAG: hypothetical protein R6U11_01850 [Bacteroidales bacterium]|jgi:hypothetical protein
MLTLTASGATFSTSCLKATPAVSATAIAIDCIAFDIASFTALIV